MSHRGASISESEYRILVDPFFEFPDTPKEFSKHV
jgi:hypothetical protein